MPIEIFRGHADQIRKAAADAHPAECCGLLLGLGDRILDVVAAANVAPDPLRHFEVDPAVLLATHRRAREEGLTLFGSYHSHPSGTLRPSANDAAQAIDAMPLWLLASPHEIIAWKWTFSRTFHSMDLVEIA